MLFGAQQLSQRETGFAVSLFVLGAAGFGWGAYVSNFCSSVHENRWRYQQLRTEIAGRGNPLIKVDDSALKFVSIIPQDRFDSAKWMISSDYFMMKIEANRTEILIEGDTER